MFKGLRSYEGEPCMTPKLNVKTGRPLNLTFADHMLQGCVVKRYPSSDRHLQERNPQMASKFSGRIQTLPLATKCLEQENTCPPFHHSSSLNLSDADKLHSGKFLNEPPMSYSCGPTLGLGQSAFSHPNSFDDWAMANERTASHRSVSPVADGGTNMLMRSNYRGTPPSNHQQRNVDTVKKIADDIIREKDSIIESQRLRMEELESRLKSTSLSRFPEDDSLLRDLQKENQMLKRQLYSASYQHSISFATSPIALEQELCAVEYKLNEYKKSSEKELQAKESKISELTKEISEGKEELERCQKKLRERDMDLEKVRSEVERMLRYMSELPPIEEHKNNVKKIEELKESLAKCARAIQERSAKLKEKTKVVESKEREIAKVKDELAETRKVLEKLQSENKVLDEEVRKDLDLMERRKLREANEKLAREMETIKKVYEAKIKQLQVKLSNMEREKEAIKESLEKEEKRVSTMRVEASACQADLDIHKRKLEEVTEECERLKADLHRAANDRKFLVGLKGEQECRLFRQLMGEFNSAFEELRCIIKICKEKTEGKEPSLDDLLGTKSLTKQLHQDSIDEGLTTEEMLKRKCQQLNELRVDIDFLRGELADFVAEDLGRRLTCSVM